ncbi:MAG: hypothetical protein PHD37_00930 [Gallionellaceae bacterium]|nr:hypothetical protein [Gallionellaceae bacterium]
MTESSEAFIADLTKMMAKRQVDRYDTELREWLELDTWAVDEGLLLLMGISPEGASVEWDGWQREDGGKINRVHIRNARLLSEPITYLSITSPTVDLTKVSQIDDDVFIGGHFVANEQQLEKQEFLRGIEEQLTRARRLWVSGPHGDSRYPVTHFMEWAEQKGISIPWLDRANEIGLLDGMVKGGQAPTRQALHPPYLTTQQTITAFSSVRPRGTQPNYWETAFKSPRPWLIKAKHADVWDPVAIAVGLLDKRVPAKSLDFVFRSPRLTPFRDAWEKASEYETR